MSATAHSSYFLMKSLKQSRSLLWWRPGTCLPSDTSAKNTSATSSGPYARKASEMDFIHFFEA